MKNTSGSPDTQSAFRQSRGLYCGRTIDHHSGVHVLLNIVLELLDWPVQSHMTTLTFGHARPGILKVASTELLDEPTWRPILLIVCETEPEEVDDHERQHRQPRDDQIQLTIQQSRVSTTTMITRFVNSVHSKI